MMLRDTMYRRISEALPNKINGKIWGVEDIGELGRNLATDNQLLTTNYPDVDIQRTSFADSEFDCVISDQILEHVEDPWKAVKETTRVLKPGGLAIHTTCFINYYHPGPIDYWRFSPEALKFMFKDYSEIIQCEGWGNLWTMFLHFSRTEHPEEKMFDASNQLEFPILTWIVARK